MGVHLNSDNISQIIYRKISYRCIVGPTFSEQKELLSLCGKRQLEYVFFTYNEIQGDLTSLRIKILR